MRSSSLLVASVLLIGGFVSCASADMPILRGIVMTASEDWRAYFEDPSTGILTGFARRDTVGDYQIEEIQENRVVLRRGRELIHVLLGVQAVPVAGAPSAMSSVISSGSSTFRSNPGALPIIASGQPWLDRLGVPPLALSRAIELALPGLASDNLDD
jgi:hypothetical protein